MIKIVKDLPATAFYNALYIKISSLYKAYGTENSFCDFWTQTDNNDDVTAIICKFYSAITVCALGNADVNEISQFLDVVGYSEVQSNASIKKDNQQFESVLLDTNGSAEIDYSISIEKAKKCYFILNQYPEEIALGDFDEWYVDISHRIRHKTAFIINHINSTALCLNAEHGVLLNGIAVDNQHKGTGLGKKLINEICKSTNGGIFAICSKENLGFYQHLGFKSYEKVYYYKGQY